MELVLLFPVSQTGNRSSVPRSQLIPEKLVEQGSLYRCPKRAAFFSSLRSGVHNLLKIADELLWASWGRVLGAVSHNLGVTFF